MLSQTVFSRSSRPRVSSHLLAGLCGVAIAGLAITGPPAAAKTPPHNEAGSVASRIWGKLLARCGDSYFYAGSVFDGAGMLHDVQMAHQGTLQFKGVQFHSVPIRVTAAERENGIASRTFTRPVT